MVVFTGVVGFTRKAWSDGGPAVAGEEFILGEAYLRMIGGALVIVGSELHLKSKRELNESRAAQHASPRPEAP
jgi:hypothetical protein